MPNKVLKSYVEELAFLDNKIAEMGGLAEHVLGLAFDALEQRDPVLAERVVELDRKVGEAIDIYVNDRLVARGEVVLVEDRLGVTMTEIIKDERA